MNRVRIKQILADKGMTQRDLAKLIGKSQSTVSFSINGDNRWTTIRMFAEALGVPPEELREPNSPQYQQLLTND